MIARFKLTMMHDTFAADWIIVPTQENKTYGDAFNMMRNKSIVSNQILKEQSKAVAVYCQGHSLSLSVKSLNKDCDILQDAMVNIAEV